MLRGAELVALHREEEALDAFGEVAARDPEYAMGHYHRAMTLTEFDTAELEAIARCALGDPSGAGRALREAKSRRGLVHQDRLAPRYDLLAAPPLAGLDQLRVIATADR
jgi:hypothetical protein